MTNETEAESFAAIRARLVEIESVLFAPASYTACNILSPNAAQLNRVHEEHFAKLRLERAELLAQLPKCGESSGQRLVISSTLGTVYVRDDPEPSFAEVHTPIDIWDWSE